MVIQLSFFGVVFDSGATTLASSPLLAMIDALWLYTVNSRRSFLLPPGYKVYVRCEKNVQIDTSSAYPLHIAGISARNTTCRTPATECTGHIFTTIFRLQNASLLYMYTRQLTEISLAAES